MAKVPTLTPSSAQMLLQSWQHNIIIACRAAKGVLPSPLPVSHCPGPLTYPLLCMVPMKTIAGRQGMQQPCFSIGTSVRLLTARQGALSTVRVGDTTLCGLGSCLHSKKRLLHPYCCNWGLSWCWQGWHRVWEGARAVAGGWLQRCAGLTCVC